MSDFISEKKTTFGKKHKRWFRKGRQVEKKYLEDIKFLFKDKIIKRDELIEYLHNIQDEYGILYDKHLVALSEITNLPLSETWIS